MELHLLSSAMSSRDSTYLILDYITAKNYSREFQILIGKIKEYYDKDADAQHVVKEVFLGLLEGAVPNKKHLENFTNILNEAEGMDTSNANTQELILKAKLNEVGNKLSIALVNGDETVSKLLEEYRELRNYTTLEELTQAGTEMLTVDDLDRVLQRVVNKEGQAIVYPLAFNERLNGRAAGGHHIVTFARPECVDGETKIRIKYNPDSVSSRVMSVKKFFNRFHGSHWLKGKGPYQIQSTADGKMFYNEVEDVVSSGMKECFKVTVASGKSVTATADHVMLTADGDVKLGELKLGDRLVVDAPAIKVPLKRKEHCTKLPHSPYRTRVIAGQTYHRVKNHRLVYDAALNGYSASDFLRRLKLGGDDELVFSDIDLDIHHKNGDHEDDSPDNLQLLTRAEHSAIHAAAGDCGNAHRVCLSEVVSIEYVGVRECFDICMNDKANNFRVNDGIYVHNCGKTAFNITMACGFARQQLPGIYFINEDRVEDIYVRLISNLTGLSLHEIEQNPGKATQMARDHGLEFIRLISLAPGTPAQVEAFVDKYRPFWMVMDQLRNLNMKEANKVLQLEYATSAMRNVAKKYNVLVISSTQAGDSAENKKLLTMGDVDYSNTGVAAQADVLVGIGGDPLDMQEGRRIINISKNKLSGRHENFPVKIVPSLSRYLSYRGQEQGE